MELREVSVGAQEPGNQHYGRSVTVGHSQTVINRRRMKQQNVGGEERLFPNRNVGFCLIFAKVGMP